MPATCKECGSSDLESDNAHLVCTQCGCVNEEGNIVSEVSFADGANGSSSVVGQFVGSSGKKSMGGMPNYTRESRDITIENGRRKIAQVAAALKLKTHHIEAAQRLFILAVQYNFIQGRKTANVVASCLYIVCRREKTPHMLIDFSDILQTNVFVLGHTFLRFQSLLNLQLPIMDPSIYIPRFASKLEFEEKTHIVISTAIKLLSFMKRDWLQTGRRPSGVCAAALYIAAKRHGFNRSHKEINQVAKICDVTLRKRLMEFANTASGDLTIQEFENITDVNETPKTSSSGPPSLNQGPPLQSQNKSLPILNSASDPPAFINSSTTVKQKKRTFSQMKSDYAKKEKKKNETKEQRKKRRKLEKKKKKREKKIAKKKAKAEKKQNDENQENNNSNNNNNNNNAVFVPPVSSSNLQIPSTVDLNMEDSQIEDLDLDFWILKPEEVEKKTKMWEDLNGEYVKIQEEKRAEKEALLAKQNTGRKRIKQNSNNKNNKNGTSNQLLKPASSPAQATGTMLAAKLNVGINYGALHDLFGKSDSLDDFTTSTVSPSSLFINSNTPSSLDPYS